MYIKVQNSAVDHSGKFGNFRPSHVHEIYIFDYRNINDLPSDTKTEKVVIITLLVQK
jgi:hypothetical protein